MKKTKAQILISIVLAALVLTNLILVESTAAADAATKKTITSQMKDALGDIALPKGGDDVEATTQQVVGGIINAFLSIFGIIFLNLMIYGGYKWLVASGREEEIKKAKDTIRSAIIGLIIVMAAYTISYFVAAALQEATTAA